MVAASSFTSLSRRFAVAAAILTAAAVFLIALVSFWLIERQRDQANTLLQEREVAFHAATVGGNLQALARRMADLADNPILATALVDSAGKETYLRPFLHGLRQINGIALQVVFSDFEGKPIADNGMGSFGEAELAWLRRRLEQGDEKASVLPGPDGPVLVGVNLLRYSRARTPEGALMYKVRLEDLKPVPWAELVPESAAGGRAGRLVHAVSSGLPPNYADLGLQLREDPARLGTAFVVRSPQYLAITAIAAALALGVFVLASRLALSLTEDLRRLQVFSSSLGDEGISHQRAPEVGSIEVRSLAKAINRMLDRLFDQHARLESERLKFLQLSNTIPQLVWIAGADGKLNWVNDRWHAFAGTTPGDVQAYDWERLHDPARLPKVKRRWRRALATGRMDQMTFTLRGQDGQYRSFITSVAPLRDALGNIVQWFGTCTDVTELEQAERAVRRSEARLQQGLVAARMAVWERDLESGELTFTANLHSVFGKNMDNIAQCWELVEPDDLPELMAVMDAAAQGDGEYQALPRIRRADDGRPAWIDIRGRVEPASDGSPRLVHAVAIDVTERKRAEEALRIADRRKDEFLAMLGHELRNPLAPIGSAAEVLKLSFSGEARVRQISEIIGRQVAHMRHLVDDLLDVSRVTRGLVTVAHEPVDLHRVVREAVEQARPLVESRRHLLAVELAAQDRQVLGDHPRLVQVVANLLNNAAKYTPEEGRVAVVLTFTQEHAVLRVSDNGVGIGPDLLPDVFELFTQATRTLDRTQGGLGLGLALVRKLIELHGGSVAVHSAGAGQGSTFTVKLPLAPG